MGPAMAVVMRGVIAARAANLLRRILSLATLVSLSPSLQVGLGNLTSVDCTLIAVKLWKVVCYRNVWADGWYLGRIEGELRAAEGKGSFLCEAEAVGSEVSSERSVCNRSPRPARNRGWLILFHLSRHVAFHSGIQANECCTYGRMGRPCKQSHLCQLVEDEIKTSF